MKVEVFAAVTSSTNSAVYNSKGKSLLVCSGGFGSGTITVKVLQETVGPTYVTTALTINAAGCLAIDLPKGTPYRFELSGATAATLTANLFEPDN